MKNRRYHLPPPTKPADNSGLILTFLDTKPVGELVELEAGGDLPIHASIDQYDAQFAELLKKLKHFWQRYSNESKRVVIEELELKIRELNGDVTLPTI